MRISDWSSDVCSSDLPQGNASTGLGVDQKQREITSYDVMMGNATVDQAVVSTKLPRLDIVTATQDLSGAEAELVDVDQRMHRLDGARHAIPAGRCDVGCTHCPAASGPIGRAPGREREGRCVWVRV